MKLDYMKEKTNRFYFFGFVAVMILAASLRIAGAGWGMPQSNLHPDEGIIYYESYNCALNRTFEVRQYYRPNHVSIKMNALLYIGIQELYFNPMGEKDFTLNFTQHIDIFITASRLLTALLGMGIVVFAFLIGNNFGRKQGLFAALLFAVFPAFIEHSHYITPDIPLLFFLMGTLWAAFRYFKKPTLTWIFWMSFFTALATCEKYPGAYGCLIIAIVVIMTQLKKVYLIFWHGFCAIAFYGIGIMAVSPVLLLDLRNVLKAIEIQNATYHLGADCLNFPETLWFYTKTTGVHIGLILSVCGLYGLIRSIKKNTRMTILLLGLLVYIFPISKLKVHWERYTLPIYAAMLLFASIGVFFIMDDLKKMLDKRKIYRIVARALLFGLPVLSLFSGAIEMDANFFAPDSRICTQSLCAELGFDESNTAHDCNTPLDPGGYYGVFNNFVDGDPDFYKYGGRPKYVMTSSAQRDEYLAEDPEVYGWIARFYERLDEEYPLVFYYPVVLPESHFIEIHNIVSSIGNTIKYAKGAATGYEIRVYQITEG